MASCIICRVTEEHSFISFYSICDHLFLPLTDDDLYFVKTEVLLWNTINIWIYKDRSDQKHYDTGKSVENTCWHNRFPAGCIRTQEESSEKAIKKANNWTKVETKRPTCGFENHVADSFILLDAV